MFKHFIKKTNIKSKRSQRVSEYIKAKDLVFQCNFPLSHVLELLWCLFLSLTMSHKQRHTPEILTASPIQIDLITLRLQVITVLTIQHNFDISPLLRIYLFLCVYTTCKWVAFGGQKRVQYPELEFQEAVRGPKRVLGTEHRSPASPTITLN